MPIGVVTDSASDLPAALAAEHGIVVVPLSVRLGGLGDAELRDVSPERFWELEKGAETLAVTSAPAPGDFAQAYETLRDQGCSGIVCVTISSELSATYQAARAGAEAVTGIEVKVIDSRTATMGEGILALEAVGAAAAETDLDVVAEQVRERAGDIEVIGTLDTLENLRRGGRIGSAQAFIGSMLSIKPVVEGRDGRVEAESRQRTRARSLRYLADKATQAGPLVRLSVVHAAAADIGEFIELIDARQLGVAPIVTAMGPVIGAHTGRGTVGVCWQRHR